MPILVIPTLWGRKNWLKKKKKTCSVPFPSEATATNSPCPHFNLFPSVPDVFSSLTLRNTPLQPTPLLALLKPVMEQHTSGQQNTSQTPYFHVFLASSRSPWLPCRMAPEVTGTLNGSGERVSPSRSGACTAERMTGREKGVGWRTAAASALTRTHGQITTNAHLNYGPCVITAVPGREIQSFKNCLLLW